MSGKTFDASRYLRNLNGRDYLEVKWRLLWLRTEHPDAVVETDLVKQQGSLALFRARVTIPGAGSATGWGSETAEDFGDYIEKAETKALGRALAALGYGTQFCEDFDFSSEGSKRRAPASQSRRPTRSRERSGDPARVVDAPVAESDLRVVRDRVALATPSQVKAIYAIGRDLPHTGDGDIESRCRQTFGRPPAELSKREASEFIDMLRKPSPAVNAVSSVS
jgi:hypothetical protein